MILESIRKFGRDLMKHGFDGDFQITLQNSSYVMLLAELVKKNIIRVYEHERIARIPIPPRSVAISFAGQKDDLSSPDFDPVKDIEVPIKMCEEIKIPTAPGYCTIKPEKPLFVALDDDKFVIKVDENGNVKEILR